MRLIPVVLSIGLALATPAQGWSTWTEVRSPHFVVYGNAGDKDLRRIALHFEQLRALFEQWGSRVDPGKPVVILAARNEETMKRLLPGYWEREGGKRPGGVYFSRFDKDYVVVRADIRGPFPHQIVYHEFVHLLNRLNFSRLPVWLNEGLADFYATIEIKDDVVSWGRLLPHQANRLTHRRDRSLQNVERSQQSGARLQPPIRLIPLDDLLSATHSSDLYNQSKHSGLFYAESAVLTHFLLLGHRAEGENPVVRYMKMIESGAPERVARREVFGDLSTLEEALRAYIRRGVFIGLSAPRTVESSHATTRRIDDSQAAGVRADLLVRTGRLKEAKAELQKAFASEEVSAIAHEAMGRVHIRDRKYPEALSAFDEVVRREPTNSGAQYHRGWLLRRLGSERRAEAPAALSQAINLNNSFAPAYTELASHYLEDDRELEFALSLARDAIRLEPGLNSHHLLVLRAHEALGQREEAARVAEQILPRASGDSRTLTQLAWYFARSERDRKAESTFRAAVAASRGSWPPRALAMFLVDRDRVDEAEAALREGLAETPDDRFLLNSLGYLNADRGVLLEEALGFIERALEQDSENAGFMDSRGWALFKLGRHEEAEHELRRSLKHRDAPVVRDHLGDVLLVRGDVEGARAEWRRVLEDPRAGEELKASLTAKLESATP